MKKLTALVLTGVLAVSCVACTSQKKEDPTTAAATTEAVTTEAATQETTTAEEKLAVMSYADYDAASIDSKVVVETYVQAKQSWWDNKATIYTQSEDGAYFIYEMPCSEEEYNKLVPGTKIQVVGFKSEWSGEVEITDATFTILDGNYVATAVDVTDLIGKDDLAKKQNQLVSFKGMTVESVSYKNEKPGDDIYVTLSKDGVNVDFCLEYYLNGSDEAFYKMVGELEKGATVDVEAFLYWYNGANPHLTQVTVVK